MGKFVAAWNIPAPNSKYKSIFLDKIIGIPPCLKNGIWGFKNGVVPLRSGCESVNHVSGIKCNLCVQNRFAMKAKESLSRSGESVFSLKHA